MVQLLLLVLQKTYQEMDQMSDFGPNYHLDNSAVYWPDMTALRCVFLEFLIRENIRKTSVNADRT